MSYENLSADQTMRERERDRKEVDACHRRMMRAARDYDAATDTHASALRAYEQRWGKGDKA